jgi:hypothetical protein
MLRLPFGLCINEMPSGLTAGGSKTSVRVTVFGTVSNIRPIRAEQIDVNDSGDSAILDVCVS